MKSLTTSRFWALYRALPSEVQRRADKAYELWLINPHAHSLYFERVGKREPIYCVRIGRGHRALGLLEGNGILWFWIGSHDEYEQLLRHM